MPGSLVGGHIRTTTEDTRDERSRATRSGLTKRYGRLAALDDLALDVAAGEVFGFLGPNGAGKSTTIRLLLGLAPSHCGPGVGVRRGRRPTSARAHRLLAYVPADVALWPQLTGAEILHLPACTGPGADLAYRAQLVERFALDLSKPARYLFDG